MDTTLEEMKMLWKQTDDKLKEQKSITDKLIIEMTQQRYKNKFSKISQYEIIGAIICFLVAAAILIRFNQLDTWYFQLLGGLSLSFLLIPPVVVLQALFKIKNLNPGQGNFSEVIVKFTKAKRQLLMVQKSGLLLNGVFLLIFLPVVDKLMNGNNMLMNFDELWSWIVPIVILFIFFFSRWLFKCYQNITASAESLLYELKD